MAVASNFSGRTISHYHILERLGAGGMGVVYKAQDTRLERFVALKFLPDEYAHDPQLSERFQREARAASALSHPSIVGIYDVGVQDGTSYLVMELLEGESLRQRLNHGPLPLRRAIEIGKLVANGLAAAHEHGIIHRDIKPENIFLTKDGHVKLLDFGLAKDQSARPRSSADAETAVKLTAPGLVMGTAPYMAPEQVRGEPVDRRADIFSLGAVLYEMLSAKPAFSGDSSIETMNAILKSEPPEIDTSVAKVPPGLDQIVRHCLEKHPGDRFQSARDLTFALGALSGSGSVLTTKAIGTTSRQSRWLLVTAILALIAGGLIGFLVARPASSAQRMDYAIPTENEVTYLALSPNGQILAYVSPDEITGEGVVFVQRIGSATASRLEGTEGATYPFWSPDAKYIAFFADGKLKRTRISGGGPEVITKAETGRGGSWGTKNVIVYAPSAGGPLWKVSADGGDASPLTQKLLVGEDTHRWPFFLPDGEHFLFFAGSFNQDPDDRHSGLYLSSLAAQRKDLVTLARSSCGYGEDHLYYLDDQRSLMAVRMDTHSGKLLDRPQHVAPHVGRNPSTYWAAFTVSENGNVVYHLQNGSTFSQLTWYDRSGKEWGKLGDRGILANPSLSPDGQRVAVDVADEKDRNVDIWIYNLLSRSYTRFTFDPAEETNAVWSHDGKTIAYYSLGVGKFIRLKSADGLERERGVGPESGENPNALPVSWTTDETALVISQYGPAHNSKLLLLSLSDGKAMPLINSSGSQGSGQISPDGKWLAYASDDSGDWEVYITPFPATGGKLQVSHGGGTEPRWRGDGKEIFYIGPSRHIMSVAVTATGGLTTGPPTSLFQIHARAPVSYSDSYSYDVTADGQRFLVNQYVKPVSVQPLNLILNGTATR